jgi:ribonuclease J
LQTEQELKKDFEEQFKKNKYNFVMVSSTNIDRVFALYHATKMAKRCFVCDSYQSKILKIVSESHKKYTSFYDIDYDQKNPAGRFIEIKHKGKKPFEFYGRLKPYLNENGFCMLVRPNDSFKPILNEYTKLNETKIYYSMWKGYLEENNTAKNQNFIDFIKPFENEYEYKHTSGHADVKTLSTFFDTVKLKYGIIPIHTEAPEKFRELFKGHNIILLQDGNVFNCV